ncbi:MAG: DUF4292 domain-containing protein [Bacteroidales bacterium]|nr:DUF4292 domain-containing protein [Bacteroidales bacterium]MDD6621708.1 DUF4292 domain-containing protein [Bacteroidales bacterium]MDD6669320.1 DUF4292 domain-containing protein [Bacteroidales bacterium]
MSKTIIRIIALAVVAVAMASCGSQKPTEKAPTAEQIQTYTPATVAAAMPDWTDATLNGKVSIGMTSSMVMKMVRGKSLSISLRPLLGIEVGKLYFEGDTVTVVDKYHNAYLRESIGNFMGEYITVETLQSLFLSRPFVVGKGTITPELASSMEATRPDGNRRWQMMPKRTDKRFSYRYEMEENRMLQFVLSLGTDTDYAMNFGKYMVTARGEIAGEITSRIPMGGKIVALDLTFKSAKWNTGLNDGIDIPADARRLSFDDILKLISNM